jgi:hypothetical protein
MAAGNYDILIEQGATFMLDLTWKDTEGTPIDISGCFVRMQIRKTYNSDAVFSLTNDSDGGIETGGVAGTITAEISAEDTRDIDIRRGYYDLEIEFPSGIVTRLIQGGVDVSREVTK